MGLSIKGISMCVPEQTISNDDFSKFIETSDEWITTRTGIKNRHITDGTPVYVYGSQAAQQALENAHMSADDIDYVIATTVTGDFSSPSLSALVAHELGIVSAPCTDLNSACAGFVYALDMAHKYLQDDNYKNILIVSAEALSRITDFTDRSTCVLFGDGAGACVVSKSDKPYASYLGSKPDGCTKIMAKATPFNSPFANQEVIDSFNEKYSFIPSTNLVMDGKEVYKFATTIMPDAVRVATDRAGLELSDLDLVIPHQANIRIVQTAAKNMDLPMDKFFTNLDKYGNTSSASIPMCLAEAINGNLIKEGDTISIVGFGAGLVYAAATFTL